MSGISSLACPIWTILPVVTLPPAQLAERMMPKLFARKGLDATGASRKLHGEDPHYINPKLTY